MKIISEDINNFVKIEPMQTVADPVLADALERDKEAQKETKEMIDPKERVKEKPFLGAKDQETPEEVKLPKNNLEESLFEDADYKKFPIQEYVNIIERYYQGDLRQFVTDFFLDNAFDLKDSLLYDLAARIYELLEPFLNESLFEESVEEILENLEESKKVITEEFYLSHDKVDEAVAFVREKLGDKKFTDELLDCLNKNMTLESAIESIMRNHDFKDKKFGVNILTRAEFDKKFGEGAYERFRAGEFDEDLKAIEEAQQEECMQEQLEANKED